MLVDLVAKKRGDVFMQANEEGVLVVTGDEIAKVASALSSPVRLNILKMVAENTKVDIDALAKKLGKSKANISTQVRILEEAGLIKSTYAPGKRGVKKLCMSNIKEIRLLIEDSHIEAQMAVASPQGQASE